MCVCASFVRITVRCSSNHSSNPHCLSTIDRLNQQKFKNTYTKITIDPGVGKTAVAEAIAQVLAVPLREIEEKKDIKNKLPKMPKVIANPFRRKEEAELTGKEAEEDDMVIPGSELPPCPASLVGARIINVELANLVAGTSNRGDFEKKVKKLIDEASNNNVILFIDEIHNLIGTGGGGDGAMNAANLMKPALGTYFCVVMSVVYVSCLFFCNFSNHSCYPPLRANHN